MAISGTSEKQSSPQIAACPEGELPKRNGVEAALDMLLEQIDGTIASLNRKGAEAFQSGRYDLASQTTGTRGRMKELGAKPASLQEEWVACFGRFRTSRARKGSKRITERLKRGLNTPDEFRIPGLQGLVEFGGSAPVGDILQRVGEVMKNQLNKYDLMTLPSDRKQVRWRNTAQWVRFAMVQDRLLASDSPGGILGNRSGRNAAGCCQNFQDVRFEDSHLRTSSAPGHRETAKRKSEVVEERP